MQSINLHNNSDVSYTQISNIFIDEYMPAANGTYVKVYITLLRMLTSGSSQTSLLSIADILDLMESDVNRALAYWEKQKILGIKRDYNGVISDLCLLPITSAGKSNPNINVVISSPVPEVETVTTDEFKWIVNIVENYMEQPLCPADIKLVEYLHGTLHFSADLIFYLYEYCIGKGKKNTKYIQSVALNWDKDGIDTVEKAKNSSLKYKNEYIAVMKAFGLNQTPAPAQKKYIDTWLGYGFSTDIIEEAVNRTIIAISEPNFNYANGIIENWHKQGVRSFDDIKKMDDLHNTRAAVSKAADNTMKKAPSRNSFNSYEQRTYSREDYVSLEQKLLDIQ